MPGFDGTGPIGRGSMTGRGRGFCVSAFHKSPPYFQKDSANCYFRRPLFGLGLRKRRSGFRRRFW